MPSSTGERPIWAQREMEILVLCERRGEILLPLGLDVAAVDRREPLYFGACQIAVTVVQPTGAGKTQW